MGRGVETPSFPSLRVLPDVHITSSRETFAGEAALDHMIWRRVVVTKGSADVGFDVGGYIGSRIFPLAVCSATGGAVVDSVSPNFGFS